MEQIPNPGIIKWQDSIIEYDLDENPDLSDLDRLTWQIEIQTK
jgi:hypothetical protein